MLLFMTLFSCIENLLCYAMMYIHYNLLIVMCHNLCVCNVHCYFITFYFYCTQHNDCYSGVNIKEVRIINMP